MKFAYYSSTTNLKKVKNSTLFISLTNSLNIYIFSLRTDAFFSVLEVLSSLYGNEASEKRKGSISVYTIVYYASNILSLLKKKKKKSDITDIIIEVLQVFLTNQTQKRCCYSDFMDHHI